MNARDLILITEARRVVEDGRLAEIREQARLSQAEVGSFCGVSAAAVSRWEAGLRRPRGRAAKRLGVLLGKLQAQLDARVAEMRANGVEAEMTHVSTLVDAELERLQPARSP